MARTPSPKKRVNCSGNTSFDTAFRLRTLKCLAPHGRAGFVLANGSISSNQADEANLGF